MESFEERKKWWFPSIRTRSYDVGLCPMITARIRGGHLVRADVTFDGTVAFVGDPYTGTVMNSVELEIESFVNHVDVTVDPDDNQLTVAYTPDAVDSDPDGPLPEEFFHPERPHMLDAARVAQRITDDPIFQRDLRRALKESLARNA